jgi:hypothetical protein
VQGCADASEAGILRLRLARIYEGPAGHARQYATALVRTLEFQGMQNL